MVRVTDISIRYYYSQSLPCANVILIRNVVFWPGQTGIVTEWTFATESIASKAREIPRTMSFEIVSHFIIYLKSSRDGKVAVG